MHILTLSHVLAEVVYTPEFWNKNFLKFFKKVTTSLSEGFSKKKSFSSNLDYINTFLSKSIKKTLHKPYKAIMHQ